MQIFVLLLCIYFKILLKLQKSVQTKCSQDLECTFRITYIDSFLLSISFFLSKLCNEFESLRSGGKLPKEKVLYDIQFPSYELQFFCFHQKGLHSVISVQIRSFFWPVFSRIRTEYGDSQYYECFHEFEIKKYRSICKSIVVYDIQVYGPFKVVCLYDAVTQQHSGMRNWLIIRFSTSTKLPIFLLLSGLSNKFYTAFHEPLKLVLQRSKDKEQTIFIYEN